MTIPGLVAAEQFVGGQERLAKLIERHPSTLRKWKKDGVIPRYAWGRIRRALENPQLEKRVKGQMPQWIVTPERYCAPLTLQVMAAAAELHLVLVKSGDARCLALMHYSRGVVHTEENSDLGRERLLEWMQGREDVACSGDG